ncbi:MAG: CdaR family protein [Kiritimatiellae bacterium]|jgi:hypothetical protein|nr:CdaR family protein [Kiritimatiellia bacterium]
MKKIMKRVKIFFTTNWYLKILAVVLASVTFFTIERSTRFEVSYTIPVEIKIEETGLAILEQDTRKIEVVFRGTQEDLRKLQPENLRAVIKPTGTLQTSEPSKLKIYPKNIDAGRFVKIVDIIPSYVNITFSEEGTKQVFIAKPQTVGKPFFGVAELEYSPNYTVVTGPEQRLPSLNILATEPVDIDGRVASFSKTVKILHANADWISEVNPEYVTVKVNIISKHETKIFEDLPIKIVSNPNSKNSAMVMPQTANVTLQAREEIINKIVKDEISIFVDVTSFTETGEYEVPLSIFLPEDEDINKTVEPSTVKITFKAGTE